MSDDFRGFVVTLERPLKDELAESIRQAIRMIMGVVDVSPIIDSPEDFSNRMMVRREFAEKLFAVLER